jgi:hypothetical protein
MTETESSQNPDCRNNDNIRTVYNQICESYRAIDVFRGTLLGALPLVSGGTFLIIGTDLIRTHTNGVLLFFIGIFGALVEFGLYIFEIYAATKCTSLITHDRVLEGKDYLDVKGQFSTLPTGIEGSRFFLLPQKLFPYVNEPLASGIIYLAVLGAWVYLALHQFPALSAEICGIEVAAIAAGICGILVAVLGFCASFQLNRSLAEMLRQGERRRE